MRKHPGIWFPIWAFEISFFLGVFMASTHIPEHVVRIIFIVWLAFVFWVITYLHGRFVEAMVRRQQERDRLKYKAEFLEAHSSRSSAHVCLTGKE